MKAIKEDLKGRILKPDNNKDWVPSPMMTLKNPMVGLVEKPVNIEGFEQTQGFSRERSRLYNGHIEIGGLIIAGQIVYVSFTADQVRCVASQADKDGHAAAALEFSTLEGKKAIVIVTERDLIKTLEGKPAFDITDFNDDLNATKSFKRFSLVKDTKGIVRPDFVPAFEDALQQIRDAKAIVALGRHDPYDKFSPIKPKTNVLTHGSIADGVPVTKAYATAGFPHDEIGTDGSDLNARRRTLAALRR